MVAIATYITFGVLAMHELPKCRNRFQTGDNTYRQMFVQEVNYGTNHDARLWSDPYEFIPERFNNWEDNAFTFMPQGGGDCNKGHRCAGELITIEVMKISLNFITNHLTYKVPKQNLRYPLSRIPTLPKSRFIMSKVRRINKNLTNSY